jgi:hypothetical protein
MGPAITGSSTPNSTPGYGLENPPVNFDPQRDAGSVGRTPAQGTGPIHQARTTDAREILPYVHPTIANPGPEPLNVRKVTSLGDSYWGDWVFLSVAVTGTFNTHIVTYTCDPPVGWVIGTAVNGAGQHCHQAARNGISFLWQDDLTAAQKTAYTVGGVPVCPPHCYKDFDISTQELAEFNETGLQDPNAGIQLAMQNGEPELTRVAGARDTIGVAAVTSLTYLVDNDLRCKMGGWGNSAADLVGRCVDGPRACAPGSVGDATCAVAPRQDGVPSGPAQGGSCRACNGPFNAITNPLGLPVGYNTHGHAELDLVAGERIGGIAGQNADVRVPLFVVGTTGNAASDFRDIAGQGSPDVDLADMGPVDGTLPFAPGVGAGGTFVNGVQLNIDEACCGTGPGANVAWDAAALGTVLAGFEDGFSYRYGPGGGDVFLSDWALTYDKGPGPDGIPGCIGDNVNVLNGTAACDQRLGFGTAGLKTDGFFATGQDDRTILYTIGSGTRPASGAKFLWRNASPGVVAYFGSAQNPPTTNTIAAFTARDLNVFVARSADILVKVNTTQCPLTNAGPQCELTDTVNCDELGGDADGDGICQDNDNCDAVSNPAQTNSDADPLGDACDNCPLVANAGQEDGDVDTVGDVCDNCPTVANTNQADGAAGLEVPPDGVGDLCDNCVRVNNPRVAAGFLTTNAWATLTGGQRDDDHDGFGNKCDGDFTASGALIGTNDLTQYRASSGKSRLGDTCGTLGNQPCARYDLDESGALVNTSDLTVYRGLSGKAAGPRCATHCTGTSSVTLPCTAGTAGSCAFVFSP